MKKIFSIVLLLLLFFGSFFSQSLSHKINNIHGYMTVESVTSYIQSLEAFGSRFEYNDNRLQVANWLKDQFLTMGFEQVELDSFLCSTSYQNYGEVMQYNVIATLPGTIRPDEIYITGGHYDSFNNQSDPMTFAPGADDNASGTTAVLETARAIMAAGYKPEVTVKFVCFGAEELMLFGYSGSEYMAESRREQNANIKLMINNDMIANNPRNLNESLVSINYYSGNEHLREIAKSLTEQYTVVTAMDGALNQWSDSRPFHDQGYPAIYFEEYDFSPYYHTADDQIVNYDMDYCTELIKASSAMLIYSIETPSILTNLRTTDLGNGTSVEITWNSAKVDDLFEYRIYKGAQPESLIYLTATSDTSFIAEGLTNGAIYFFGVTAVDEDGNESYMTVASAIPNILPHSPVNVLATAKWHAIELNWQKNTEMDLIGYKIYKVPVTTYDYFPNLTYYTTETKFTDTEIESGLWYQYTVVALDADSNESIENSIVTSRAVTLDRGILFVNETSNSDGSIGNPTLEEVEDFYSSLPASNFETYNVNTVLEENFDLANLGAHHTLVWHIDKSSDVNTYQYLNVIKEYLDYGGNILFTGYKPTKAFENSTSMNNEFSQGDFLYDYAGITQSQNSLFALFKSARSESPGYPDLELDPLKINTSDGHIKTIEAIIPADENNVIYSYVTDYEPTNVKGANSGKPVGIEYLSDDYNIVLLSLPLYLVKKEQAAEFLNYVLTNKFNTPTSVFDDENEKEVVTSFYLSQNYPNPFNPSTSIKYSVETQHAVSLRVYDMLGREIATLVNEVHSPGSYEIEFDASKLSSGIYFYRLTSGSFVQTRKMMLIK